VVFCAMFCSACAVVAANGAISESGRIGKSGGKRRRKRAPRETGVDM
jgi:hypothetical protein